jgi:hypothetical protein
LRQSFGEKKKCRIVKRVSQNEDKNVAKCDIIVGLSHFLVSDVSVSPHLANNNDKGEAWVHMTVMLLWSFTHDMWKHQSSVLLYMQLEASCVMREAESMMCLPSFMRML